MNTTILIDLLFWLRGSILIINMVGCHLLNAGNWGLFCEQIQIKGMKCFIDLGMCIFWFTSRKIRRNSVPILDDVFW